ncbi:MAG: hypothetical protein Kow0076_2850 [Francisella sp.]
MKIYFIAISLLLSNSVFASGAEWYLDIRNHTKHTIDVTGIGGDGNYCWESEDLDNHNYIKPNSSKIIFTREKEDTCDHPYQNFLIDGHYASIGSRYDSNPFVRYFNNDVDNRLGEGDGTFNAFVDKVALVIDYVGGDKYSRYKISGSSWGTPLDPDGGVVNVKVYK